jgi:hypothetical protein
MPTLGSAANFCSRLWAALEYLFDTAMYTECHQIVHSCGKSFTSAGSES